MAARSPAGGAEPSVGETSAAGTETTGPPTEPGQPADSPTEPTDSPLDAASGGEPLTTLADRAVADPGSSRPMQAMPTTRPVGAVGDVLLGRYRLREPVASDGCATLWRAVDRVLSRPVAVRILDPGLTDRPASAGTLGQSLLLAAGRAGQPSHHRLARVYDAARDGGTTFVVTEWVEGTPLAAVLREGPLDPRHAAEIAYRIAEALVAVHAAGAAHGRLHPDNVVLTPDGRVKITDLETAAVRAARPATADPVAEDTRATGALLYAMLTARWPHTVGHGLPAAPVADGRLCTPRQVRAGVPPRLDRATMRALDLPDRADAPGLRTPGALLDALDAPLPATEAGGAHSYAAAPPLRQRFDQRPSPQTDPEARPEAHARLRPSVLRVAVPATLAAALAVGGWLAGRQIGQVPGLADRFAAISSAERAAPDRSASAPTPLPLAGVTDFDPPPGDGQEAPELVPAAHDGDPSTAWHTDRYRSSPDFGGIKGGVGLLADLGRATTIGAALVSLTAPGATVELRAAPAATTPGRSAADFSVLARVENAPAELALRPAGAVSARFWLVWITRLPPAEGGGFREGVRELAFRSAG